MEKQIFISYASKELDKAEKVCLFLEGRGIGCWIAPRDILPGTEYGEEIIKGIENSKALVLIYSEQSNSSQHVLREIERAVSKRVPIIAYKIEESLLTKSMEYFLLTNQWLDATGTGDHLEELYNSIRKITNNTESCEETDIQRKIEIGDNSDNKIPSKTVTMERKQGSLGKLIPIICTVIVLAVLGVILVFIFKKPESKVDNLDATEISTEQGVIKQKDIYGVTNGTDILVTDQTDVVTQIPTPELPEETPAETKSPEEAPAETKSPEEAPAETKSPEEAPAETKSPEEAPAETKSPEEAPAETKSPEEAPAETKSPEEAPAETKSPEEAQTDKLEEGSKEAIIPEIGQYINFGHYKPQKYNSANNDDVIKWRIINIDDDKVVLLSDKVLDMKPFDCAESGMFEKDAAGNSYDRSIRDTYSLEQMIQFRGSNDWETSNIRTWLNSSASRVVYNDAPPVNKGTDEYTNGYDKQAGFLYGFTSEEQALLCEVSNSTSLSAIENEEAGKTGFKFEGGLITDDYDMSSYASKQTTDKVYLLSVDEVKKYLHNNNLLIFTEPTKSAIESDDSPYYRTVLEYDSVYSIWALRTPNGDDSTTVLAVSHGVNSSEDISTYWACASGLGIRPAVTISLKDTVIEGEGTEEAPYAIR